MGTRQAPYSRVVDGNISIETIPYSSIECVDFAKCADPKETLSAFYNRQVKKPAILINGGLFNMSTGHNVESFVDEGKEQNYQNGFQGFGVKYDDVTKLVYGVDKAGAWKDFMSAKPVLLLNGSPTTRAEWGNAASINYLAARTAIGYNDENIFIVTVDAPGCYFTKLQEIFVSCGATYAINLDGGGSVRKLIDGKVANTPTEDRPVDNVFAVYLKEVEEEFVPGVYEITASSLNIRNAPVNGTVIGRYTKGEEVTIDNLTNNDEWGEVAFDTQVGYISMNYVIRLRDYVAPVVDPLGDFADRDKVSDYAREAMEYMVTNGIITGSNSMTLDPAATITKEQLAVVLYRYMKHLTE